MEFFVLTQNLLLLFFWSSLIILIIIIGRLIWHLTQLIKLAHYNLEILTKSVQKFNTLVEWGNSQIQILNTVLQSITHLKKYFRKKTKNDE